MTAKAIIDVLFLFCVAGAVLEWYVAGRNWYGDHERWIDGSIAALLTICAVVLWRFV